MVKADYFTDSGAMLVEVGSKRQLLGILAVDYQPCSLFVCTDCGYSEFRLDKEHLGKLKQHSLKKIDYQITA